VPSTVINTGNKHFRGHAAMIRKTLIALSAAAVLATGMSAAASAKTNINIDLGFGVGGGGIYLGGGYPVYGGGYPVYVDDYGPGCGWQWVPYKKVWNPAHTKKVWKHKKIWVCG
jgi:hypothetical protein